MYLVPPLGFLIPYWILSWLAFNIESSLGFWTITIIIYIFMVFYLIGYYKYLKHLE